MSFNMCNSYYSLLFIAKVKLRYTFINTDFNYLFIYFNLIIIIFIFNFA